MRVVVPAVLAVMCVTLTLLVGVNAMGSDALDTDACEHFTLAGPGVVAQTRDHYDVALRLWLKTDVSVSSFIDTIELQALEGGIWVPKTLTPESIRLPREEVDVLFLPDVSPGRSETDRCPHFLQVLLVVLLDGFDLGEGDRGTVPDEQFGASDPGFARSRESLIERFNKLNPTPLDVEALRTWQSGSEAGRTRLAIIVRWRSDPPPGSGYLLDGFSDDLYVVNVGKDSLGKGGADSEETSLLPGQNYFTVDSPDTLPERPDASKWEASMRQDLAGLGRTLDDHRRLIELNYDTRQLVSAPELRGEYRDSYVTAGEKVRVGSRDGTCWRQEKLRFAASAGENGRWLIRLAQVVKAVGLANLFFAAILVMGKVQDEA